MTTLTEREWQTEMERLRARQRAALGKLVAMGYYLNEDEMGRWEELLNQARQYTDQMQRLIQQVDPRQAIE